MVFLRKAEKNRKKNRGKNRKVAEVAQSKPDFLIRVFVKLCGLRGR
jgi:hypothetical protein